ncbi:MAG: hypothetical protein WEB90_04050 [Gemmatimonadota bacterium]
MTARTEGRILNGTGAERLPWRPDTARRPSVAALVWTQGLALVLVLVLGAAPLGAQCVPELGRPCAEPDTAVGVVAEVPGAPDSVGEATQGTGILGRTNNRRRIIPALFVLHPFYKFPEVSWSRGVGIQASPWFFAGFMNSYDRLSIIAGVEREWFARRVRDVRFGLGYRAGILTGYDERLLALAATVPVLPFGGLLAWVDLGRVGIDTFYVYKAITVEGSFGF